MTLKALPVGWGFEDADPSVGIFGYSVWHDACKQWQDEDCTPAETVIGLRYVPRNGYVEVETRTQFTCPFCGEVAYMYDTDISSFAWESENA